MAPDPCGLGCMAPDPCGLGCMAPDPCGLGSRLTQPTAMFLMTQYCWKVMLTLTLALHQPRLCNGFDKCYNIYQVQKTLYSKTSIIQIVAMTALLEYFTKRCMFYLNGLYLSEQIQLCEHFCD